MAETRYCSLMPASAQCDELERLRHSIEEELKRLKSLAEEIENALRAVRSAAIVEKARRDQANVNWLQDLQKQYSHEVCERTLAVNGLFPIAQK